MSNLKLITTETFNNLPCNFYRNMNNDILLTREQIGQALEYADPSKAIRKIHLKHKDRLDDLCVRIKLGSTQNGANLSKSEEQERVYYTERGIMEICRWSRQKQANIFMDWVWDTIEKYRHNELTLDLSQITTTLASITNTLTALTQTITSMQQETNTIKETKHTPNIPKKKYSYWTSKMFPKYQLLTDYFQISNTELYKNLYAELENTYPDIDLNQEMADYCYVNNLDTCYTLDVIEHNSTIRKLFESIVDNLLQKYNLINYNLATVKPTIFDN